ncbi:MAG: hypothetical protein M3068_01220 [Gemmatimonadota bacterium]|nr:hypothetical protein [Gemmatimonadota bacterium]
MTLPLDTRTPPSTPAISVWEEEGRRNASSLDRCNSAIVVGDNPDIAAQVALGIGRMQARRRRVAIGDLVGELPSLQRLVPADMAHGLVDSFVYGVSLSKVAYPIDPAKNLFVLPSGTGPIDHDAVLRSDRWRKLASGFREVDALLMIVVPPDAPTLNDLIAATDGAVVVGGARLMVPGRILLRVASPGESTTGPPINDAALAAAFNAPPEGSRRPRFLGAAAVIALVAAIVAFLWVPRRPSPAPAPRAAVSARALPPIAVTAADGTVPVADSVARDSSARTDVGVAGVAVADPADADRADAWSVMFDGNYSTFTGANAMIVDGDARVMPAATVSPVVLRSGADEARWYRVHVGAFRSRAGADSLLGALRRRKLLTGTRGRVLKTPFALLVETGLSRDVAEAHVRGWRAKGLPAYALLQDDGNANIYAGAFETPEQASLLSSSFPVGGLRPPIVYRIGSAY